LLKIRPSRKIALAWVTLGIGLLATVLTALQVRQGIERDAVRQFAFVSDQVTLKIHERLDAYTLILRGGAALFAASKAVDRHEWRAYVEGLQANGNIPGVQGVGFAQAIRPDQLAAHVARIRGEGFPDYTVRPPGGRELYTSIIYLEPFRDRNLRAFGFDMYSEPVRRAAMERARDTGLTTLSDKVVLVQETATDVQAGVLVYVPVYRNDAAADTVAQRRAALLGWVYSPYRMNDLMTGILGDWDSYAGKTVDLQIYAGTEATPASLLFDSKPAAAPSVQSLFYQQRMININGQQWLLVFDRTSAAQAVSYAPAWAVLTAGFALSGLLFGLMLTVINTEANAARIAQGLTAEIRHHEKLLGESEAFKLAILNSLPAEVAVVDRYGVIRAVNEPWRRFALENGIEPGKPVPHTAVGDNYLAACQKDTGFALPDAMDARNGIQAVLDGRSPRFSLEYPCHSPTQQRWFTMTVLPLGQDIKRGVVITHTDITRGKIAEAAITEARNLLLSIIDTVPMRVFWKDRNLRYLGCNTAFAKDAGMAHPQDVIGKDDYQMGWATQADLYRADDRAVMDSCLAKLSYDEPQTTPGGQTIWLRSSKAPLRNQDGEVSGLLGIYEDISAYKEAELKLRESEEILSIITSSAQDAIIMLDAAGHIAFWNQAAERIFGYAREEALGRNLHTLIVPLHYREAHRKAFTHFQHTGQGSAVGKTVELTGLRKDGSEFPLSLSLSAVRVKGAWHSIGLLRDITERKLASEALQVSEQRFRKLLQEIPSVAVQGYGPDGTTHYWNEASEWLYGFSELEAVGRNILDLIIPPPMHQAVREAMAEMFETGQPIPASELSLKRKDGSKVDVFSSHAYVQVQGGVPEMFCVDIDLTARKQAEEKLQLAASVFTHAREGIMITSADGTIMDVNDAFTQITSYGRDEVLGQSPRLLSSGRQGKEFYADMWRQLIEEGQWFGEVWNRRKDGEFYAVKQTISAVCDAQGNIRNFVALLSDITQIKEHEQRLEHIAHYDALTSLPNRVLLADRLHQGMVHAQRHTHSLAVAFLDLDGFKAINDRHGHEAGDQLLIAVATHMKQSLREGDTLARIGGDEFVAMLSDLTDIEASVPIITRILAAAAQPVQFGDITLQVSASLGVTFYPRMEDIDADQLLRQADQAMYQAKLAGKNCYHFFDDEHDRSIRGHHESLEGIRHALSEREFVLYFQPKVNMRLGTVIGAEALIRWQHPERGLLPPSVFLPVIEDHPLAVEIGEWVIDSALTQMERWHAAGLDIPVSVNVGARQLLQADFVGRLRGILASHPNFRPGYLELEVLETSALEDLVRASQVIEECRGIGVVFDLDDFGTGYSSLTYLKRLPITHLKIDQSFVRDMLDDPDDLAILEGVIGLSAAFRRQVIAEGVETVEHGEMLLQLGCELAQGYGIARPMPTGELPLWAASWRPDPAWVGLPPVNRDDLPLLYASVEHRAWIVALESQLRGLRETAPGIDRQQCRFGAWLASGGRARYDAQPAFAEVERLHSQVHGLAAELGGLQSQGPGPETLARLGELLRLHDALLAQMKRLMQDNQR
jgi:diguanylate cyclase (GGDEF)-like protein/PAS domain S-box-containing protein